MMWKYLSTTEEDVVSIFINEIRSNFSFSILINQISDFSVVTIINKYSKISKKLKRVILSFPFPIVNFFNRICFSKSITKTNPFGEPKNAYFLQSETEIIVNDDCSFELDL